MSTPTTLRSEIKGFKNFQRKQGGITVSKLKPKQEVLIETTDYMYNLVILEDGFFYVQTGSPLFESNIKYHKVVAHSSRLKFDMEDWIGKEMRLILSSDDGLSVMIGEVKSAVVKGIGTNGRQYRAEVWG